MTKEQITVLAEIERVRRECRQLVDSKFDALASRVLEEVGVELKEGERVLTLAAMPSAFKGKKPVSLILPGGAEVSTPTWKKAVTAILQDCSSAPRRHRWMLELRGRVFGNFRPLLAKTPEGMGAPLKIDEELYWESKFDTEALLRNLTDKLLSKAGYDYQGVVVRYLDPQMGSTTTEETQEHTVQMGQTLSL
ncbi:hypothetical protein AALA80_05110 [Oscillospiraceae bacterium 50-60]